MTHDGYDSDPMTTWLEERSNRLRAQVVQLQDRVRGLEEALREVLRCGYGEEVAVEEICRKALNGRLP